MKLFYLLSSLFIFYLNSAHADQLIVTQNNLQFSNSIEVIKTNDIVTFKNEDNIIHNIVSLTKDFEFDLGKIEPGMIKSLQFTGDGVVDVECTVHPNMKMTLFIRKQY